MKHSWLEFPVLIANYVGARKNKLHITARYLGHQRVNHEDVETLLSGRGIKFDFKPTLFYWTPEIFVHMDEQHHVLKLNACPQVIYEVNHETTPLFPNQFEVYTPHITVDAEYWDMVKRDLIPAAEVLKVQPVLRLINEGLPHYRWAFEIP